MIIYEDVFKAFQREKFDYVIVGGIALNLLGVSRATADLDLLIGIDPQTLREADRILRSLGYRLKQPIDIKALDPAALAALIKQKNLKAINYYQPGELKEIDIIVDSPVPFAEALKRARRVKVSGLALPVMGIDDLIAMKRASARQIDTFDILQLKKLKRIMKGKK
ncbi:MAG TPA: nucleotidyltransferase [Candidatus Omnitrophota bacterium]|nr:nucleotidyltransferase [Candidatus Omnitrophota bacterium]HRZ14115.1 nucleotidyltransferase [Candidatus Omnitrophota bacterium]